MCSRVFLPKYNAPRQSRVQKSEMTKNAFDKKDDFDHPRINRLILSTREIVFYCLKAFEVFGRKINSIIVWNNKMLCICVKYKQWSYKQSLQLLLIYQEQNNKKKARIEEGPGL